MPAAVGRDSGSWIPDPRDREQAIGWSVDLPAVLSLLKRIGEGAATAEQARDLLLEITQGGAPCTSYGGSRRVHSCPAP